MATKKSQRIGIWIIAVALTIGTLAGFVAIVLAPNNQKADQQYLTELTNQYQVASDEYQRRLNEQTSMLSSQYFDEFNQYAGKSAVFNASDVTELKTEDLKIGSGTEIGSGTSFVAYYIGWTPDGNVFDSSINGSALSAPITAGPGDVIEGWTEGTTGMKEGGVRELTIPSDKAYGSVGGGDQIAPNTPLKFIIMVIPAPEIIPQPEIPADLLKYYSTGSF